MRDYVTSLYEDGTGKSVSCDHHFSSFSMPYDSNSDPRDDFLFYPTLTHMINSYMLC